jgi:hypothetical protein
VAAPIFVSHSRYRCTVVGLKPTRRAAALRAPSYCSCLPLLLRCCSPVRSELLQLLVAAAPLLTRLSLAGAEREALAPLPRTWGRPRFTVCSHGGLCQPTWKVPCARSRVSPERRVRPECRPRATCVPGERRVPRAVPEPPASCAFPEPPCSPSWQSARSRIQDSAARRAARSLRRRAL